MRRAQTLQGSLPLLRGREGVAPGVRRARQVLIGTTVGLTALGLVVLYSSSSALQVVPGTEGDPTAQLRRQLPWVALAALAAWTAAVVPLTWLRRLSVPILVIVLGMLVMVLLVGREVNNSKRWLSAFGMNLQPSELLKLAVLFYLADFFAKREEGGPFERRGPLLGSLAPIGLSIGLVLVEPDLGSSLFIVAEVVVLLALAGIRPTRVLTFAGVAAPIVGFFAYTRFPHVRRRLAGPSEQAIESVVAIGSGGFAGQGLGAGTHKLGYVPEAETDFIFAVIGEELGFIGCASVVIAFMALTWYGSRVALSARILGAHAFFVAAGATFIISLQALTNIAVVTAVVPTKGISLPFISRGGSNLIVVAAAIGLLVNVATRTIREAGDDPYR